MLGAGAKLQKMEAPVTTGGNLPNTPSAVLSEFGHMCVAMSLGGALVAVRDLAGLRCTVSFGDGPAVGSRPPTELACLTQCIETGEVVLCEDAENSSEIHPWAGVSSTVRSLVTVPIEAQGSVVGLVQAFSAQPSVFSAGVIAGLQRVAKLFAGLMIFDAAEGGPPVIGGSFEKPIALPKLIASAEPTSTSPSAETVEEPETPETRAQAVMTRAVGTISPLPSDRRTPTRVWLIAVVLLLCLSLFFLFLLRSGSRIQNGSYNEGDPSTSDFRDAHDPGGIRQT
jgi:hypothetical protein